MCKITIAVTTWNLSRARESFLNLLIDLRVLTCVGKVIPARWNVEFGPELITVTLLLGKTEQIPLGRERPCDSESSKVFKGHPWYPFAS